MNKKETKITNWGEEYKKCMDSPHYFATKYVMIKTEKGCIPFTSRFTEKEFNKAFNANYNIFTKKKRTYTLNEVYKAYKAGYKDKEHEIHLYTFNEFKEKFNKYLKQLELKKKKNGKHS